MRHLIFVVSLLFYLFSSVVNVYAVDKLSTAVHPSKGSWQVAFAPWDDVEEIVSDAIDTAHQQIFVQAYLLSSKKLANALSSAQRRGIDVKLLVDAEKLNKAVPSVIPELAAAGIQIWIETKYQHAHNKIIVIDPYTSYATVITGSYNFTWTAQHKNAENVLVIRGNPELALRYAVNWERHRQDAMPYKK